MYEKKETFPKVLVISHNVFSNTSNMGRTLKNFFIGWDKDSLAQLYLRSEIPTTNVCENYFRITDFDMLKKSKMNHLIKLFMRYCKKSIMITVIK